MIQFLHISEFVFGRHGAQQKAGCGHVNWLEAQFSPEGRGSIALGASLVRTQLAVRGSLAYRWGSSEGFAANLSASQRGAVEFGVAAVTGVSEAGGSQGCCAPQVRSGFAAPS